MTIDQFKELPKSLLKDVTATPTEAAPISQPSSPTPSGNNTITEQAALQGANNTKISTILPLSNGGGSPVSGTPIQQNTASASLGGMLEAKLAIDLMDSVLPGLMVAAFYYADIHLKKTDLQLTEKEKTTVTPIFQKCLDTIFLNFDSPWTLLAVTLGIIYGAKISEKGIVAWIDKNNAKHEQEAAAPTVTDQVKEAAIKANEASIVKQQNEAKIQQAVSAAGITFSEDDIKAYMKRNKVNRAKAIKGLGSAYYMRMKRAQEKQK